MRSRIPEGRWGAYLAMSQRMRLILTRWLVLGTGALAATGALAQSPAPASRAKSSTATPAVAPGATPQASGTLATQVQLDRAGFSPGEIDGQAGLNLRRALSAFQRTHALTESGKLDAATRQKLAEQVQDAAPLLPYEITGDDVAGPFTPDLPSDLMEQSKLMALTYRTALEGLAEKFHASPRLLQQLNKGATFSTAGEMIVVPNVVAFELPAPTAAGRAAAAAESPERGAGAAPTARGGGTPAAAGRESAAGARGRGAAAPAEQKPPVTIVVTKAGSLTVEDEGGRIIFHAPVTSGSEHDPLPIGTWKVNGVQRNPPFQYNPALFWDADPTHAKAKIPAGPNNPVGVAWIDISKEHYGIHGTPEPSRIGHVQSHGCVRLTNWDVQRVAQFVKPGTVVIFK